MSVPVMSVHLGCSGGDGCVRTTHALRFVVTARTVQETGRDESGGRRTSDGGATAFALLSG